MINLWSSTLLWLLPGYLFKTDLRIFMNAKEKRFVCWMKKLCPIWICNLWQNSLHANVTLGDKVSGAITPGQFSQDELVPSDELNDSSTLCKSLTAAIWTPALPSLVRRAHMWAPLLTGLVRNTTEIGPFLIICWICQYFLGLNWNCCTYVYVKLGLSKFML